MQEGIKHSLPPVFRYFAPPFPEKDYYKTVTYKAVLDAVRADIKAGEYDFRNLSAEFLNDIPFDHIGSLLRDCLLHCRDLFKSDEPGARRLVSLFGDIVNKAFHSIDEEERQRAKEELQRLVERPKYFKNAKKEISYRLSLDGLFLYTHRITMHVWNKYRGCIKDDIPSEDLKGRDPRLKEIVEMGHEELLKRERVKLTCCIMAPLFDLTEKGLNQRIKEERQLSKDMHLHPEKYEGSWAFQI